MIKILLVDKHPIVKKGLDFILANSKEIQLKGSIDNGEDILSFLKSQPIDVMLCEIDLPKMNGITALRQLKKQFPDTKVLFFSGQPEDVYAISAVKAGGFGYLSKSATGNQIIEAIESVNKGEVYLSEKIKEQIAKGGKGKKSDGYNKKLSTREVEVLKLLASGKKNKEIAKELAINEKTVSTYKARLMRKLNVTNLIDLVYQANSKSL